MSTNRLCCAPSPHGGALMCMRVHGHSNAAALVETFHRDGHGNTWTDVPVATPLSTPEVTEKACVGQWAPPPVVAPTITAMAAKCIERMAVLDRVRPIFEAAIKDAKTEDVAAWAIVAVRVSEAILRDGGR